MSDARKTVYLRNAQQAGECLRLLYDWAKPYLIAGHQFEVATKPMKRSSAQNAMMWSCLNDVARQVEWYGQKLDAESWKDMATAALKRQRVVPGIDGGFVVLGQRTSKMTIAEMTELIDFLHCFGDARGVNWSQTSLGRDVDIEDPQR